MFKSLGMCAGTPVRRDIGIDCLITLLSGDLLNFDYFCKNLNVANDYGYVAFVGAP